MVSNTTRIDAIARCLGELHALEKKVKDLTNVREGFDLAGLIQKFKELEGTIELDS